MSGENIIERMAGGHIVLYLRSTKGSAISYRIRIPGLRNQYERRSTGEWDIELARAKAKDRYDELRFEQKKGRSALPRTVRSIAARYIAWLDNQVKLGVAKPSKLTTHRVLLNANLLPFFGDMFIDKIKTSDLLAYDDFRLSQPKRINNKGDVHPTQRVSGNTLAAEKSCLSSVMWYAINVLDVMKQTDRPERGWGTRRSNRRPAFTDQQLVILNDKMLEWAKQADGINAKLQRENWFHRQRLVALVKFLGACGARIGEIRACRWRHWTDGTLVIQEGKTNERVAPLTGEAEAVLIEWRATCTQFFGNEPGPENFLFEGPRHQPLKTYSTLFNEMLEYAGMTHEPSTKKKFTIYSLRHYFGSSRKMGDADSLMVAKAMGTSVKMLEEHYVSVPTSRTRQELEKGVRANPAFDKIARDAAEAGPVEPVSSEDEDADTDFTNMPIDEFEKWVEKKEKKGS